MRDAVLDYRANPEITEKCPKNLEYCKKETKFDPANGEDGGKIEGLFFICLCSLNLKISLKLSRLEFNPN